MKRLAILLCALLIASPAFPVSHTWENDGADGWTSGDDWDADNINSVKDSLDLILGPYTVFDPSSSTSQRGYVMAPVPWISNVSTGTQTGYFDTEIWSVVNGQKDSGLKSTVAGWREYVTLLTESENYNRIEHTYCGADSDCIGVFRRVHAAGGAQTVGDEGLSAERNSVSDFLGTAVGTIGTTISSGANSAVSVSLSGVTKAESREIGARRWMVFTDDAVAVDIVEAPSLSFDTSGAVNGGPASGVWTLGTGEGTSHGSGWCFAANLSNFTSLWTSTDIVAWLPIVSSTSNTITTEAIYQGADKGTPYGYLAEEGTDTGQVAPCGEIGVPTLNSSYVTTSATVTTGSGFPGATSGDAFEVHPYPFNPLITGESVRMGRAFGTTNSGNQGSGFTAMNSLTVGRMQLGPAFDVEWNVESPNDPTDVLADGNTHAWLYGLYVPEFGAEIGYSYTYNDSTVNQWPIQLDMGNTNFGTNDNPQIVVRVMDAGAANPSNTSLNLTVDKTSAWGQNNDPFITANRTQTITGAKTLTGSLDSTGGTITVPTASAGDNDTSAASTAFVTTAVNAKSAASSTDNAVPKFDSTAGDVQNSGVLIDDSNNLTVPGDITSGTSGGTCMIFTDLDDGTSQTAVWTVDGVLMDETDTNGVCGDAT